MKTKFKVGDGVIDRVELICSCFWLLRLDVWPFLLLYTFLFLVHFQHKQLVQQSHHSGVKLFVFIVLPLLLCFHLLLFLLTQGWSIALRVTLGGRQVFEIKKADKVYIVASTNAGNNCIVVLHHRHNLEEVAAKDFMIAGVTFSVEDEYFIFQKVLYGFETEKNTFVKLAYPTSSNAMSFLKSCGVETREQLIMSKLKWGFNEFDIPIPSFFYLYSVRL